MATSYDQLLSTLTGSQRDAAAAVLDLFNQYGLGSLAQNIISYVKDGYSSDTVSLLLQQTPQFKARFAANDVRIKKGLPALSPAEYLATERAYGQVLRKYGLPSGFYDQPADFQKFLENDVSASELDQRAKDASDFINRANPQELAYFQQHYTKGDMVAYALDPQRAEPLIGRTFQAAEIGGQAAAQGIGITTQQADQLAGSGLSADQAMKGFGVIATDQPRAAQLAAIYNEPQLTTQDLIDATFNANAADQQKITKLASQERASFGGASGVGRTSLSSNDNAPV